jgi:steroid 5-alpha reductase family enzyme
MIFWSLFSHHLCIAFILIFVTWLLYLKTRNMSVIDITWAIGFSCYILYDFFYIVTAIASKHIDALIIAYSLASITIFIWSLRLALFLYFTRIKKNHLDPRYEQIKSNWKSPSSFKVLYNYCIQGALQVCISCAFIPLAYTTAILPLHILPLALAFIAIIGEALADFQLLKFKKTAASNAICTSGLWKFSRHPNYFFDILFWFSIALFTYVITKTIFVFLAPVLLYIIMRFLTGRISEKLSLEKKGASFKMYQESTYMIFPKFFSRNN